MSLNLILGAGQNQLIFRQFLEKGTTHCSLKNNQNLHTVYK